MIAFLGNTHAIFHDCMQFGEMFRGLRVVAELAGRSIERRALAEPIRIVHQVAEDAAIVGILRRAVGQAGIAFATRGDERAPVATRV